MEDAFDVRENNHFAAKSSAPPSIATLPGPAAAAGANGLDAPRHDSRSLARDIQVDRRRRSDAARQPVGTSSPAQSAPELEPLRGAAALEPFARQPSRSSARSRDTVQYATLEHTGALAADTSHQKLLNDGAPAVAQVSQRRAAPGVATEEPARRDERAGRPESEPRLAGGVAVLPPGAGERVHPRSQPRPQDAFVAHAKSIPNMTEYDDRPPSRFRPRSVEALDRDGDSESSRPGTPKVPRFHFVEPYDVVQLPDDYQYNSSGNLAGELPRLERREEAAHLRPAGYVPPQSRPVPPAPAPRAAPHQAQIVVQLASRPQEPGREPLAGTPPPAYRRTPEAESREPRRYVPPETDL